MNQQSDTVYLVVSAIGRDRPGLVNALTREVNDNGGNILDSRMTVLGGEFAIIMLIAGNPAAIQNLEQGLAQHQDDLGLTVLTRRTEGQDSGGDSLPYRVEVVALDHPGIVHQLAGFFSAREINIQDIDTDTYRAAHTGSPMFIAHMVVNIPAATPISKLRREFLDYCDSLNLDATLEAERN